MKKREPKIVYYSDSSNDDFAGTNINQKSVDSNFKFVHTNPIWRGCSFLIYYLVAIPLVWIYTKIVFGLKIKNKKALKQLKRQPCFLYGNHTGYIDAFSPNLIGLPKRNKIIVGADTVSIKGLKNLTQMLGALPIPTGSNGMKEFLKAVNHYHKKGFNITIYPEAHIWPYYTGVREFGDTSFAYPVKLNSPVVAFFTAYTKPKGVFGFLRKVNTTVYVSEPFYPNPEKNKKEAQKELHDKVFNFMKECSEKYSNYEVVVYKHISEKPENGENIE